MRAERLNLLPANFLKALDGEERISEDPPYDYERNVYCIYPDNSMLDLETFTKNLELEGKDKYFVCV